MAKPKKILPDHYYICNATDLTKPFLLRWDFESEKRALDYIIRYCGWDTKNFVILKSDEAIKYGLKFNNERIRITKYDYPYERVTKQKRKTYRTIMRRRLRKLMSKINDTE